MHVLVVKFQNWDKVELQDKLVSSLAEKSFALQEQLILTLLAFVAL